MKMSEAMDAKEMMHLHYFGLEPIKNRYTEQLTNLWFPEHLTHGAKIAEKNVQMITYAPWTQAFDIKSGVVLDAVQRSITALAQSSEFIQKLPTIKTKNNVLFLQDFWNPGLDAIFYTMHVLGVRKNWKVYSMLHAQSVDEYDFTWNMRKWMRHVELGYAEQMDGIFVASTVHKELLRSAGIESPIHVVGLPIGEKDMGEQYKKYENVKHKRQAIFTSRYDWEKNPLFLAAVIDRCLDHDPLMTFVCTTGASEIRSNTPEFCSPFIGLRKKHGARFRVEVGITKDRYYKLLRESQVQFNCSLQDFVSWTLLESISMGCLPVFPKFRSFNEMFGADCHLNYNAFDCDHAVKCILSAFLAMDELQKKNPVGVRLVPYYRILKACILGGDIEASIILGKDYGHEINVWHEIDGLQLLYGRT